MRHEEQLQGIIDSLGNLSRDMAVPKNIKERIDQTISVLKEESETSMKINKALHLLDEIADDTNLKSYTRTQIWNVVSLLEKV